MASRLRLQALLEEITEHVYFQPPNTLEMQYPCIIYHRDLSRETFADNKVYTRLKRYLVTVVDRNPDSELSDKVEDLPYCTFYRHFAAENLNHFVFTLFF